MLTEEAVKKMKSLALTARMLDEYGIAQHLEKAAWAKTSSSKPRRKAC
jgi:hypothetical protein